MNSNGFTLIEVMISLLIFAVVIAGMTPVFVSQVQKNTNMEQRMGGINAAQFVLDELRMTDPTLMQASGSTSPATVTIDGKDFLVTTHFCENPAFCQTANNRHIRVEVHFGDRHVFETETVYTQLR